MMDTSPEAQSAAIAAVHARTRARDAARGTGASSSAWVDAGARGGAGASSEAPALRFVDTVSTAGGAASTRAGTAAFSLPRHSSMSASAPREEVSPSGEVGGDAFRFQERHGRLDMRAIARLDLDAVVASGDVGALQAHLANLTFGRISREDLEAYTDDNVVKLFQLSQLTIEYMMDVQSRLHAHCNALEDQCKVCPPPPVLVRARALCVLEVQQCVRAPVQRLAVETDECAARTHEARSELDSLRHALRQKKKVIRAYEALLLQSAAHTAAGEPGGGARVASFPCAECPKVFGSGEYLGAHVARAHGGESARVRTSRAGLARDDGRAEALAEQARALLGAGAAGARTMARSRENVQLRAREVEIAEARRQCAEEAAARARAEAKAAAAVDAEALKSEMVCAVPSAPRRRA